MIEQLPQLARYVEEARTFARTGDELYPKWIGDFGHLRKDCRDAAEASHSLHMAVVEHLLSVYDGERRKLNCERDRAPRGYTGRRRREKVH